MAATIKIKNSSTAGAVPTSSDLVQGELAINVTDRRIFTENASGTVVELGTPSIDDNGNATAITIDSSENVGIGTSSPASRFQAADASASGTTVGSNRVGLFSTSGTGKDVNITFSNLVDDNVSIGGLGGVMYFLKNSTERMRIDTSGNLLVGTTSTVDSAKFVVTDAEGNDFAVGRLSGGNRFVGSSSIYNKTTANAANVYVNSSSTAYAIVRSTSSIKYKKDVEDAVHGLAEVLMLRPVTYRGKEDGDKVFGGLIAEEVHDIGLTEFVQYDEDGSPDALAYGPLVSLAFKAIQEQQAMITSQSDLITSLTARIEALEQA